MWKIADFLNARRPVKAAETVVSVSKVNSKEPKTKRSNFVLKAAALQAIFGAQNRQNRGFSRRAAGKNGGHRILKLPTNNRPLGRVVYQFSEKLLEESWKYSQKWEKSLISECPPPLTDGGNGGTGFKIPQQGSLDPNKQLCLRGRRSTSNIWPS